MAILCPSGTYVTQPGMTKFGSTACAWIQMPSSFTDDKALLARGLGSDGYGCAAIIKDIYLDYQFHIYSAGNVGSGYPITSAWFFVAVCITAAGQAYIYTSLSNRLGILRKSPSLAASSETNPVTSLLALSDGSIAQGGAVSTLKTWTRELSMAELLQEMVPGSNIVNTTNQFGCNLLTTTATLADTTGNGHTAVINGAGSSTIADPTPTIWTKPTLTATWRISGCGDSRMLGTNGGGTTVCTVLQTLRPADTIVNYGVSGSTAVGCWDDLRDTIEAAFSGILSNVVPIICGVNDAFAGDSADTIFGDVTSLADRIIVAGGVPVICTEIDCESPENAITAAYNALLKACANPAWVLNDMTGNALLMNANSADFSGDQIHPNAAGYTDIAGILDTTLDAMAIQFTGQFNGWMEYVKVYATAHSLAQVQAQAAQKAATGSPWAQWDLELGVTTDSSGNARNLAVVGTPTTAPSGVSFVGMSSPKILSAATGAATSIGTAATPRLGRKIGALTGGTTTAGTAATPRAGRKTNAATGAATGAGSIATPHADRRLAVATGSTSTAGTAATPKIGRRVGAATGASAGVGTDATLSKSTSVKQIAAATGAATTAGQAATPHADRKLSVVTGATTTAGQVATPYADRKLSVATGATTTLGQTATPHADRRLATSSGASTTAGQNAGTKLGRTVVASTGTTLGAGTSATPKATRKLAPTSGAATSSGSTAGTRYGRNLPATTGASTGVGQTASERHTAVLAALTGSAVALGQAVTLTKASGGSKVLNVVGGSATGSGTVAAIRAARKLVAANGGAIAAGQTITLAHNVKMTALTGSATGLGTTANTKRGRGMGATTGAATGAGTPAIPKALRKLIASTGSSVAQGQDASVIWFHAEKILSAASGGATGQGSGVALKINRRLQAAIGQALAAGYDVSLDWSGAIKIIAIHFGKTTSRARVLMTSSTRSEFKLKGASRAVLNAKGSTRKK